MSIVIVIMFMLMWVPVVMLWSWSMMMAAGAEDTPALPQEPCPQSLDGNTGHRREDGMICLGHDPAPERNSVPIAQDKHADGVGESDGSAEQRGMTHRSA